MSEDKTLVEVPQSKIVRAVDVRKNFHIGHQTLKNWEQHGLPTHVLGGSVWYNIEEIEEFVSSR